MDRRVVTTIVLYLSVLIPALHFDDVGVVLAWTGTVAATSLSFIGPGMLFLGVHGQEFLDSAWSPGTWHDVLGYLLLMPLWNRVAAAGAQGLCAYYEAKEAATPADEYRLGRVEHRRDRMVRQRQRRARETGDVDESETGVHAIGNGIENTSAKLGLIIAAPENSKIYGATSSKERRSEKAAAMDAVSQEEDPQDEPPTAGDFAVAIAFIYFGVLAFTAGIYSILQSN